jgi:HAD superfamily hydrolase (TIGR01662 family)
MPPPPVRYSVVVPTTGRASLERLLTRLGALVAEHTDERDAPPVALPAEIVLVDDRPQPATPLPVPHIGIPVRVLRSGGRGPAAARNAGWRAAGGSLDVGDVEWIVFLDDDVLPGPRWLARLTADLGGAAPETGASQGRIEVPLPADRQPTDLERGTAGLSGAPWITADMAYRRAALHRVSGFDERFRRAYREDADLALRVIAAGYEIVTGGRRTTHPVRPAGPLASVRAQRGNGDDALMRRKHRTGWRKRIGDGPGRLRGHLLTTAAALGALAGVLTRHRGIAGAAAIGWAGLTARFAWQRIRPGPRDAAEIARMVLSSISIPPVACWHRLAGELRWRRVTPLATMPAAVFFDRDDTLVHDVPYNADPAAVRPVPGARAALERLRMRGVPVGVVSNQSGVARGLLTTEQLARVNAEVTRLLGPFDVWGVCMHREQDRCACRKPAPGLVTGAAAELGVSPRHCVLIGDTGADVTAAERAGARGILVPTSRTLPAEVRAAGEVAPDICAAVQMALHGRVPR